MSLPAYMSEMVLYHYWRSSSSWRVRWALEIKGLKAEMVQIDLMGGENEREPHLSRNPMGWVPVLKVGERHLFESMAIMEWLDEQLPAHPLFPGDGFQRAHIRALCEIINAGVQPVCNLTTIDYLSDDPAKRRDWSVYFIDRGLKAYEKVAQRSAGIFSVGQSPTAADLCLIPQVYNALRNDMDLNAYPLVKRIYERALMLPEVVASHPDRYQPK